MTTTKWTHEPTKPVAPAPRAEPGSTDYAANKGGLQNDANPEARNPNPTAVTPREGTEPGPGLAPHHGGGFAKTGSGGYSGGCVPEAPPPPEPEVEATKKKPEVSHGR